MDNTSTLEDLIQQSKQQQAIIEHLQIQLHSQVRSAQKNKALLVIL